MAPELEICSVSYRHSRHLLKNFLFSKSSNPNTEIRWLIVNNDPNEDPFDDIFQDYYDMVKVVSGPPNNFQNPGRGSKHHAAGIDLIVPQTKTRFVLILDPDFYIILPNWVVRIINYMIQAKTVLLGVPWHPKWGTKRRYYPSIHCLFVDTKYIDLSGLSFMPKFKKQSSLYTWQRIFSKIPLVGNRVYVEYSQDTGYQIYEYFSNSSKMKYELAVPSFSRTDLYNKYRRYNRRLVDIWTLFNKTVDKVFPESMSVFPKKKGYFTTTRFSDLELPDCKRYGWEEFFWKSEPFGFHIRGVQQKSTERYTEMDRICRVLQSVTSQRRTN